MSTNAFVQAYQVGRDQRERPARNALLQAQLEGQQTSNRANAFNLQQAEREAAAWDAARPDIAAAYGGDRSAAGRAVGIPGLSQAGMKWVAGLPAAKREEGVQQLGVATQVAISLSRLPPEQWGQAYQAMYDAAGRPGWWSPQPPSPEEVRGLLGLSLEGSKYIDQRPAPGQGGGDLWARVVQAESGGDPKAISPKGAVGRGQIMPATARDQAKRYGRTEVAALNDEEMTKWLLENPRLAEAWSQDYFKQQQNKYGNDALALAAYNAGPGMVDVWLGTYGDPRKGEISLEEWIGQIPYAETRNYVTKIMGYTGQGKIPAPGPAQTAQADPSGAAGMPARTGQYVTPSVPSAVQTGPQNTNAALYGNRGNPNPPNRPPATFTPTPAAGAPQAAPPAQPAQAQPQPVQTAQAAPQGQQAPFLMTGAGVPYTQGAPAGHAWTTAGTVRPLTQQGYGTGNTERERLAMYYVSQGVPMNQAIQMASEQAGSGQTINFGLGGDTYQKQLADTVQQTYSRAASAREQLFRLQEALPLVDSAITGTGADWRLWGSKALGRVMGVENPSVGDTEFLASTLSGQTLALAESMSGALSENDMLFLRDMSGQNIELSGGAIKRIIQLNQKTARRAIERHQEVMKVLQEEPDPRLAWQRIHTVEMPDMGGQGGGQDRRPVARFSDPNNREVILWDDGQYTYPDGTPYVPPQQNNDPVSPGNRPVEAGQ